MDALDDLAAQWRIAKDKEEAAKSVRIFVENEILKLHPARSEGSESFKTPAGSSIKLTGKLTYKADMDLLAEITKAWPEEARPFKTEVKVDEAKLKTIRNEAPRLWADIAKAVTCTPAKVGVVIDFKE